MKQTLVLIRHSQPDIRPDLPAPQWSLSKEGRQRCKLLAGRLAAWQPGRLVTSLELKAIETGRLVAGQLGIPFETAGGLHEHERTCETFTTRAHFQASIAAFFRQPDTLVFGDETANQASRRFSRAVTTTLARYPRDTVGVVAHGTVMTLFVAQAAGVDPFPFWQTLGLPAFAVFSRPEMTLLAVEEYIS